jgi:hypothetical protein
VPNPDNSPIQSDDLRTILSTASDLTGLYVNGYCPRDTCAWRWQSRSAVPYANKPRGTIRCGRCSARLKHFSLSPNP